MNCLYTVEYEVGAIVIEQSIYADSPDDARTRLARQIPEHANILWVAPFVRKADDEAYIA